jgi:peptidoglycan/LPS O-acetylase OafA/YrhL
MAEGKPMRRILELDSLRGVAAIMVVFFHYSTRFDGLYGHSPELGWEVPWGHLGVHLFFIISGFVIFLTLQRTRKPKDFIVSRFARLYPAYWISVLFTFTVVAIFGLPGREVSTGDLAVNMTMLQNFLGVPAVDGVYWSLRVELTFYFWIFLLFVLGKMDSIIPVAWFWLVGMTLTAFFELGKWTFVEALLLWNYGYLFIAGIGYFYIFSGKRSWQIHALILACLIPAYLKLELYEAVSVTLFFGLFFLFAYGKLVWFSHKILLVAGSISYVLYLIHQNVGYVILRSLKNWEVSSSLKVALAMAICVAVSWAIHLIVEEPARKAIRKWYKKRQSNQSA